MLDGLRVYPTDEFTRAYSGKSGEIGKIILIVGVQLSGWNRWMFADSPRTRSGNTEMEKLKSEPADAALIAERDVSECLLEGQCQDQLADVTVRDR